MGQRASSGFCRIEASLRGALSEHVAVSKLLLSLEEPGGLQESSPCFILRVLSTPGISISCLRTSRYWPRKGMW